MFSRNQCKLMQSVLHFCILEKKFKQHNTTSRKNVKMSWENTLGGGAVPDCYLDPPFEFDAPRWDPLEARFFFNLPNHKSFLLL